MTTLKDKTILLVIGGGIAAYKGLELIRLLRGKGAAVECILTKGGGEFITPLSVTALAGRPCHTDMWVDNSGDGMDHIRLARRADLIVIAPATANLIARAACGMADDLATTTLLAAASDIPLLVAPAMNPHMYAHPAVQDNLATLSKRGALIIPPAYGDMACGEKGEGRLPDPALLAERIESVLTGKPVAAPSLPLSGKRAIVTSGPTFEPIDPVRFIGNRSSGKQGHAVACALRDAGADVTYVTGPTALPHPVGVHVVTVETARDMMAAVNAALPADIAVCAAAVADYGVDYSPVKQKKVQGKTGLDIIFRANPDILRALSQSGADRPAFIVGFAAETDRDLVHAREKLLNKGCDAIVLNEVGRAGNPVFGSDTTGIHWITKDVHEEHENISKIDAADIITREIIEHFAPAADTDKPETRSLKA